MIQVTSTTIRANMLEQVMRVTNDDAIILPFLEAVPASRQAHAALGRLLSEEPVLLLLGCPLIAFVANYPLDPAWRDYYPPKENSLWETYEFLNTMYGSPEAADPYTALEKLRDQADLDLQSGT